ncbi:MAG TPA: hypothetical protein VLM85_09415 [Polyangiaceae bacterium]|nr:hypothetical protein [Polyangiaceae bacterium]
MTSRIIRSFFVFGLAACSSTGSTLDAGGMDAASDAADSSSDSSFDAASNPDGLGGYRGTCGAVQCVPGACAQILCVDVQSSDGGVSPWCGCQQYLDGGFTGSTESCGNLLCASPCTCADAQASACACP